MEYSSQRPLHLQADRTFGINVVITTSQILQNYWGSWIFDSDWHIVVADEAHDFFVGPTNYSVAHAQDVVHITESDVANVSLD